MPLPLRLAHAILLSNPPFQTTPRFEVDLLDWRQAQAESTRVIF